MCSKIYQTLQSDRMKSKEQLFFWKKVHILNRIWIKIPESKIAFVFELKLLEVQTCLKKSDKFSKFLFSLTF
jgi:hypothetical protein